MSRASLVACSRIEPIDAPDCVGRLRRRATTKPSVARASQDLRDVWEKNALTNGQSAVLPHCGHATLARSCSLIVRVTCTSRRHLSQWYSYTGMAAPPRGSKAVDHPPERFGTERVLRSPSHG